MVVFAFIEYCASIICIAFLDGFTTFRASQKSDVFLLNHSEVTNWGNISLNSNFPMVSENSSHASFEAALLSFPRAHLPRHAPQSQHSFLFSVMGSTLF
jgi:hypothetical protein